MNSSGIKRGAAVLTVAALAIGTPVAVYAVGTNADADVYAVTQSADATSVPAYAPAIITGKATAKGGADLYTGTPSSTAANRDYLSVKFSETLPAGTAIAPTDLVFGFDQNGDGDFLDAGDATVTAADLDTAILAPTTLTTATTVTATFAGTAGVQFSTISGDFKYGAAGAIPGAVTVTTGNALQGGTASTTLTVGKVQTGNGAVASLVVTPGSVDQYDADTAPTYTVTALDANGVAVDNAVVKYTLNGTYVAADQTTELDSFGDTGEVDFTIAKSGAGKTDNIVFFVEGPTTPNANKVDAGDPQKSVTAKFTTPATISTSVVSLTPTITGDTPTAIHLPGDKAAVTVPVKLTVKDGSGNGIAGVRVAVDTAVGGGGTPAAADATLPRVIGTTAADGTVTLNVSVPAADATPGTVLTFAAYVSGSDTAGQGDPFTNHTGTTATATFSARAVDVYFGGTNPTTAQAQATAGGTVSLPVVVKDQFGKPASNATLAYEVNHLAGDRGNDTTADKPLTTDADGKATIAYTDAHANSTTSTDKDEIVIKDAFGSFGTAGTTLLNIDVTYLSTLAADATKSLYNDEFDSAEYAGFAGASTSPANENTGLDTDGVPTLATVVGFGGLGDSTTFAVKAVSAEGVALTNHDVKFEATGSPTAILFDSTTLTAASPTTGVGSLTVKTDAQGIALVTVTTLTTGDVTVKATSDAFSHTFNVIRFEPDAGYNVSLTTKPASITPGSTVKFIYTVTDEFGNKVYGFGQDGLGVNENYGFGDTTDTTLDNSFFATIASATAPGTIESWTAVDDNSQFAVVLKTLDSDSGDGSFVVTPNSTDYAPSFVTLAATVHDVHWDKDAAAAFVKKYGTNAQLAALIKPYVGPEGLKTDFTIAETKVDPTLSATAKTQVTKKVQKFKVKNAKGKFVWVVKAKVGKKHVFGKKKVASVKKDTVVVSTNAPAGTVVTVNGKTAAVAGGSATFTFTGIKTVNKVRTYTVSVPATDTTNAKTITVTVK